MKTKSFAITAVTVIALGASLMTATAGRVGRGVAASDSAGIFSAQQSDATAATSSQQPVNSHNIKRETNPELIPDHVAYMVMFQYIAGRETDADKARARDYIKNMGVGADTTQPMVVGTDNRVTRAESAETADVDALIAAAEEQKTKFKPIDEDAKKINPKGERPTPEMLEKYDKIKQRKEKVTTEIAASLPTRLTANGAQKVKDFVLGHIKRQIEIVPLPIPEAPIHAGHH